MTMLTFFAGSVSPQTHSEEEKQRLMCVGNLLHIRRNIKPFLEPHREIGEALLADGMRDGIFFVREVGCRF
jgi:hypothetical protein